MSTTSTDAPSYNSTRVQRAYRINNIENARLQGRLHLLEKEKLHKIRMTNQDIRLISLTLEYIQSSSGRSSEGRAPEIIPVEKKDDQGPCFLYGERVLSRKVRRFQRPQSAFDRSGDRRDSESSSGSSTQVRPQSSPAKRKPTISWNFSSRDNAETSSEGESETESEHTRHAWEDDTTEVTKRILRAQEGQPVVRVALHEQQIGHLRGQRDTSKAKAVSLHESMEKSKVLGRHGSAPSMTSRKRSSSLGRNANLDEILNQRRPTLSASTWRSHLSHNDSSPVSFDVRSQSIRNEKLKLNNKRQQLIQKKLNGFKEKYPFRQ
ncbi:uncharacterized protein LOC126809842 [Patella vulgata]|uniref:uncharacterized protein LOC126809842 n=1 Tax=Patella vulgata TaxID=6465 RepID=UPI00217F51CB|nr:uncharacterized protein LOC126809842 [Patella vulgata]XP_050390611.1 uncharacterized protein LOC126809842 [Patella vulgata]